MNLAELPLAELRRRFAARDAIPPPSLLAALAADSREGARALARTLRLRRERAQREARRSAGLFRTERALGSGEELVAGVDEVGVGPLAGPVVAAAVLLPRGTRLRGLDDSKRVPAAERERLDREIRASARSVGIGWASVEEIDRMNVYRAALLAMRRAVDALALRPELLLVDARRVPDIDVPQRSVPQGDGRVGSIAAASIVAKVYRDAWMCDLDRRHPGFGFARNAGYGTPEHLEALERLGPSPAHRFSFAPVRAAARPSAVRARAASR